MLSRLNDDWLYGEMGRDSGTFPANFIDNVPSDLPPYEPPKEVSSVETPDAGPAAIPDSSSTESTRERPEEV